MVERRFRESNRAVGGQYGQASFGDRATLREPQGVIIEAVFSEEVLTSIAELPTAARSGVTLGNWSST